MWLAKHFQFLFKLVKEVFKKNPLSKSPGASYISELGGGGEAWDNGMRLYLEQ